MLSLSSLPGTPWGGRSSDADKAKIAELERVIDQQAVEIQAFKKMKLF